ncbi:MAG: hypothetical protein HC819_10515 [Cyclobacteriaceae bacterium]|nr:hypothetical protein [Cyclobacteriaceae bacterium]
MISTYFEGGQLMTETNYQNDLITGISKEYYENGSLKSETSYKFGRKHGLYREWFENQQLKIAGQMAGNKKVDSWIYYDQHGKKIKTEFFENNKLIKTEKSYD